MWRLLAQGEIRAQTQWLQATMKLGEVLKFLPPSLGYSLWPGVLLRFGTHHSGRPLSFRAQRAEDESLPMFLSAEERMQGFHWYSQPALLLEFRPPVSAMGVRTEPLRPG